MFDLESGEIVWTVTGQESGAGGVFAERPASKAKVVFKKMFMKWSGFCK